MKLGEPIIACPMGMQEDPRHPKLKKIEVCFHDIYIHNEANGTWISEAKFIDWQIQHELFF